jgi:outer membrane protein OmpA-like peptidoglycan-associated protein
MKAGSILYVALLAVSSACPQMMAAGPDGAASPAGPGSPHPVEAEAVQEPLQSRSASLLRVRRAQLRIQLNRILPTRDTARGLVVTVPETLLADLNTVPPETSARLAKIAAMIPADVTVRVEGYTDDRRATAANQATSYGRAQAVRDVLVENDESPRDILAKGFVSNAVMTGRPNRCVEIVISGRGIGSSAGPFRARADAYKDRITD